MITFFSGGDGNPNGRVFAVDSASELPVSDIEKLEWLFGGALIVGSASGVVDGNSKSRVANGSGKSSVVTGGGKNSGVTGGGKRGVAAETVEGDFVGPRREMITPWSTNAVEITQNMGVQGIRRVEEFCRYVDGVVVDPMLSRRYTGLGQDIFEVDRQPEPVREVCDIAAYNAEQGLALSAEEVEYLQDVSKKMGRPLTDSEVFGFSQVNSEHCRHKIFNGEFVIDGVRMDESLFGLIKKTTKTHPGRVTSAYKDNCAFLQGPVAEQFAPARGDMPDYYMASDFESVISLKAETHNFPTTVEPFNGAATGSGGEIRDRIAGGKGAFPLAGTAVYMTAYPQLEGSGRGCGGDIISGSDRRCDAERPWENFVEPRKWLYQTPEDILIKASNGASDFGNKFGQPLVCGSLLTFEHQEDSRTWGYDKVIMLAGGVGYGKKVDSLKDEPTAGDAVVLLGGDNYRIGMGGGAVSSVATGEFAGAIELNAVQRSNPEMQRRAYNAIRAVAEGGCAGAVDGGGNPIISIHDHGAGGHLNCLSELVEATGGRIDMEKLPVGDPTLSAREIVGNESQERMGLVVDKQYLDYLRAIAERERAPMYVIGETTGDGRFTFVNNDTGERPIDWPLEYMFGRAPRTVLTDNTLQDQFELVGSDGGGIVGYGGGCIVGYIEKVLQLEAVACKDWLTNKVDRSVGGRVAVQQTVGELQLPLNDCAVVALDYQGVAGVATSIGHAPVAAMIDPAEGSRLAIAESLTNLVFAPLTHGLKGVSLSANWMWPCKNSGEDARLYRAVEAASEFAISLGINIPTGKDSLSMTQKYPDGGRVLAPGTVIISAAGEVSDVSRTVKAALRHVESDIVYVDFSRSAFELGGSSFAQVVGRVGDKSPAVSDADYFRRAFDTVQQLVNEGVVLAGHDVSAGGLVTALLEMTFADNATGMDLDLSGLGETDVVRLLFSERPAVVLQVAEGDRVLRYLREQGVDCQSIGRVNLKRRFNVRASGVEFDLLQDDLRDKWYRTSYLLDRRQSGNACAELHTGKRSRWSLRFRPGLRERISGWGLIRIVRRSRAFGRRSYARRGASASVRRLGRCIWPVSTCAT